ncbi:MAG: DUF91 domain-containing protein [Myxococcales bacterium]|nr:DUF91 domain-containing protein [Myxococcales bacterium]
MYCKLCNTRLNPGEKTCQNCGSATTKKSSTVATSSVSKLPSPELSTARDLDVEEEEVNVELELDDVTVEIDANADSGIQAAHDSEEPQAPEPKIKAKPKTETRAKAKSKIRNPFKSRSTSTPKPKPAAEVEKPSAPEVSSPESSGSAAVSDASATPFFAPDPAGLRTLLIEQPDALEPGLNLYCNDDGTPVGADYSTGVGDIDLLATDSEGGLVVVMISEKNQGDELVAEVLKRVGWVRKHLGEEDQRVRGIVLCEDPPENLSYAAAAVADTVSFKTYRVALTFEDLEV